MSSGRKKLRVRLNGRRHSSTPEICEEKKQQVWEPPSPLSVTTRTEDYTEEGLTMTVLDQFTSRISLRKVFPIQKFWVHWVNLQWFLKNIPAGRIVMLGFLGGGSTGLRYTLPYLSSLGSTLAQYLHPDSNWIWIFVRSGKTLLEASSHDLSPILSVELPLLFLPLQTPINITPLRRKICARNEILGELCELHNTPPENPVPHPRLELENINNVPVIICAGSRLHYFYYTLKTLLNTPGVNKDNIIVIIGGYNQNYVDIVTLLSIDFQTVTMRGEGNSMLFQYYRDVYEWVSKRFPNSPAAIFIDEDVEISPDFFFYMNQTLPILLRDSSVYCVNSVASIRGNKIHGQANKVLRANSQVTWGYAVSLNFIKEALSRWPKSLSFNVIFDFWLMEHISNKRDCIFPEQSRAAHIGIDGKNTEVNYASESFIYNVNITSQFGIKLDNIDDMIYDNWRKYLSSEIMKSEVVAGNPCGEDFASNATHKSLVFYFYMDGNFEVTGVNFQMCGFCLGLWGLSNQGIHDGVISVRPRGDETVIHLIAVPLSSFSSFKPANVQPWDFRFLSPEQREAVSKRLKRKYVDHEYDFVKHHFDENKNKWRKDLFGL